MKPRLTYSALLMAGTLCVAVGSASAQKKTTPSNKSFEEFRNQVQQEFNQFKQDVLDNYAKWLDGEWVPFQPKMVLPPHEQPKPAEPPVKAPDTPPAPVEKPKPLNLTPRPDIFVTPSPDGNLADLPPMPVPPPTPVVIPEPDPEPEPVVAPKPEPKPEPEPVVTPKPEPKPEPIPEPKPTPKPVVVPPASKPLDYVTLYGMEIGVDRHNVGIDPTVRSTGDMARHWKRLDGDADTRKLAQALGQRAKEMGFNGYLTYELAAAYVMQKYPDSTPAAQLSLIHYLMTHAGFDARLATTADGTPLLMMPFDSTVYGRMFITVDGRNYTLFTLPGAEKALDSGGAIYTANLPKGAKLGEVSTLRLDGLDLPYKPYSFDIEAGDLHLTGTLNENLFPLLYRYPQMPLGDYASSTLMPALRKDLANQVRAQLGEKSDEEAVNSLLSFFHRGFDYATDQDAHGFEKPYFLEETLYYPQCDCEDRAIMMTTLMWEGLGLENVLIGYPGHESAAVHLENPVAGTSYTLDGKTYYSSDPTFIGARVGDCMPSFRNESPDVDKINPDH